MASVGRKNTGPEVALRKALHRSGLRYKLHDKALPGSPDIVFPRFEAVVFVHGCYWHSHGCYRSTVPKSREDFWINKFQENRARDRRNVEDLLSRGWRVLTVWECALKGKTSQPIDVVVQDVRKWLASSDPKGEVSGEARSRSADLPGQ